MISQARVGATLPAGDIERARRWYEEKLGLTPVGTDPDGGLRYQTGGGTMFAVFPTGITERAGHTQMAIEAADARAEVAELRARGVVFEEYDQPGLQTVDGLVELGGLVGGWFKDSEGNLIGIFQAQ
ncbi:VOC family protein [Kitasatospora sp. NPDC058965]|uniref:VOC family protein n=1 Tax=Kitasatospora sp. NPDC058965 TaxID=3346682 RepID=UPI0036D1200E